MMRSNKIRIRMIVLAVLFCFQLFCQNTGDTIQKPCYGYEATEIAEGQMFKRIAHVSLKTKDLQKSLEYYSKLGFTVQFMFTNEGADYGAYLKIGPSNFIEIFEDKNLGTVVNNGIAHFCLETDSIDAVITQLTALEIPFTEKKFGCDSSWQIWLTDPDGNKFEVHQYTENSMQLKEGGSVEIDW